MSEIITEKWLRDRGACEDGIKFAVRNKLVGASLDQIHEVEGDFDGFVNWVRYASKCNIEYDDRGNMIKKVDSFGDVWTYEYDDHYNLIKKAFPDGRALTYKYDENDNLIKKVSPSGRTWTYEYDQNNNLIKETDSFDITYEYDDRNNQATYAYNDRGNVIKQVFSNGDVRTWEYLYYDNGQLKEIVDHVKFPKIG